MNGDNGTSAPHNQQLRALLFTDLCDSLLLVERIGDVAAAELFQEHDRLVLALQQRWNGQLIDRSDGLFMLFERPIDALGFALGLPAWAAAAGAETRDPSAGAGRSACGRCADLGEQRRGSAGWRQGD